jgi:hypothetical protein
MLSSIHKRIRLPVHLSRNNATLNEIRVEKKKKEGGKEIYALLPRKQVRKREFFLGFFCGKRERRSKLSTIKRKATLGD